MSDAHARDETVLRTDLSTSGGGSKGPAQADAPRVLKSRFVLEEKLGSGGMGTVFRAKDLRKVEARDRQPFLAIKVLNNDFREHPEAFIALQREAAKSQSLSHPNIVSIFDFDKDGDVPFMTMELLEGQELADLLKAYPNGLPEPMAWDVIRGICAGLKHAHEAGIVHADFKPGNVFVTPSNTPKILDFGIARAVQLTDVAGDDTVFDPTRLAALTPAYASREMLAGDNPEPRDDLYSLGIVIYLILTGRHPYGRLPAEEAASEELKPERPRGLSRRQWQVLSRCLAFNRQDRPQSIEEVERYLLAPSPWPARVVLALLTTLLVVLLVNYFIDDAELSEVKQEVRQSTLVDAQLERLESLLSARERDADWESAVATEFDALGRVDKAGDATSQVAERIRNAYAEAVLAAPELETAVALLERGSVYGDLSVTRAELERRWLEEFRSLLDGRTGSGFDASGTEWLTAVQQARSRMQAAFPGSSALAEIDLELTEVLEMRVHDALAAGRVEDAQALLAELAPRLFDAETLESLEESVRHVREQQARAREAARIAARRNARQAELDDALSASCLRMDLSRIERLATGLLGDRQIRARVAGRLSGCLSQLAELDPDRALSFEREIAQRFAGKLALAEVSVDPCSLSYLVGNGSQTGRQGYCVDSLGEKVQGPRLVVLPTEDGQGRYAMTRSEISWAEFRTFCVELEGCTPEELEHGLIDERLPVTGVSLETAQAFARWLSERTGHTYRLPTVAEWQWAATGEPDPNRNCRVQIDGVERGRSAVPASTGAGNDFGLKNMLGNVQEWVIGEDGVLAAGGSFQDPISACIASTLRPHAGLPAPDTGFRLVREIT